MIMTTTARRTKEHIHLLATRQSKVEKAKALHIAGYTNAAAAHLLGIPESTYRNYIKES